MSVILISFSSPLPTETKFLVTICNIFRFWAVTDSRTKYGHFGLSNSSKSIILLLWRMVKGSRDLHNSHSIYFQQNVVTCGATLLVRLEFSHCLRQSTWIFFIVPEHIQGLIRGFKCWSSSPKHILQASDNGALTLFLPLTSKLLCIVSKYSSVFILSPVPLLRLSN